MRGRSRGTATDVDGRFSLNAVNETAVLVFASVVYQTQVVTLDSQSEINVSLIEHSQTLEEVVVVGYGTQVRENLTGAVGQIDADDLAMRPDANIVSALQGMIPGLNIQVNSGDPMATDRKSTRLNSSHVAISYAVFCLKKKRHNRHSRTRRAAPPHSTQDSEQT